SLHAFFFYSTAHNPNLHSFPTRRSSDLRNDSIRYTSKDFKFVQMPDTGIQPFIALARSRKGRAEQCTQVFQPSPMFRCELDMKRSEEHTSELQSLAYLVCRLLLEKKK